MIVTNLLVTAYCACSHCCPLSSHGLDASGHRPVAGITVAASRQYPLGTHIKIQGMTNDFVVTDRLAKRYDDRVDIFMSSHVAAKQFGIHKLTVYVNIHPSTSAAIHH